MHNELRIAEENFFNYAIDFESRTLSSTRVKEKKIMRLGAKKNPGSKRFNDCFGR